MTRLLRLDTSPRPASASRALGDRIEAAWCARHPAAQVARRDLAAGPPEPLGAAQVAAFFTPPAERSADDRAALAASDAMLAELAQADTLLVTLPVWNFGPPAALKAWVDQIVRVGETFVVENGAFRGLARLPRAIVAVSAGAAGYRDGAMSGADFAGRYMEFVLRFIGIRRVDTIWLEGMSAPDGVADAAWQRTEAEIAAMFDSGLEGAA